MTARCPQVPSSISVCRSMDSPIWLHAMISSVPWSPTRQRKRMSPGCRARPLSMSSTRLTIVARRRVPSGSFGFRKVRPINSLGSIIGNGDSSSSLSVSRFDLMITGASSFSSSAISDVLSVCAEMAWISPTRSTHLETHSHT